MTQEILPFIHIFVDHSNMWGGGRAASQIRHPRRQEKTARISIAHLDRVLGGDQRGVSTKIVSGGVPPGMEGVWAQYQEHRYDTQRLFRDAHWRERGVDHSIIGHMWRLLALHETSPTVLVLASGDGKKNEFGTSFLEVLDQILTHSRYASWTVRLASFDWDAAATRIATPTAKRMRRLVDQASRGTFLNLMDHYAKIVYHQK